jgi:hypothetical protein
MKLCVKRFGLVCSCILFAACSKLDVITGPFFVTFDADASVTANLVVEPLPANFSEPQSITGGQKLNMNLFFTVPEISVHGGASNDDKIWNVYKVIPGGFTYTIRKAENYNYTIVNSLNLASFDAGETVYLHELRGLWGDFRDTTGKTAMKITKNSVLNYELPYGKANAAPVDPVANFQDAKLYTATPSFYFSTDANGINKITTLKDNTPIRVQVAKAGGALTITLSH